MAAMTSDGPAMVMNITASKTKLSIIKKLINGLKIENRKWKIEN
jgi:hypothetical protein